MKIEIKHLSRIEGHANLVVDAERGELKECRLEIVESPRFFEGLVRGRHYSDVAPIIARICGVCSHSHTLASLMATEAALQVEVSEQTRKLRKLLAFGEILQSHLLQLYFMAVPDYLGVASIFPLAKSHRELVMRALGLKKLSNALCETIGGRPVHPVTPCVGGFAALPSASSLQGLRRSLVGALPDLEATVDLFAAFTFPDFSRETEYLCLDGAGSYPLLGGQIVSTDGVDAALPDYAEVIEEYLVPHSTAKFARATRESYMVGPLARYRNGAGALSPMAGKVAAALGLTPGTVNAYHSLLARLVEVVHCVEEAIHLVDQVLLDGLQPEAPARPQGGGCGVGAIEAPRGTLFHAYEYDEQGCVVSADCLIPTAQNLGNIEADLRALVPLLAGQPRAELTASLEKLVRAYDPCISCSTHLLDITFLDASR